MRRKNVLQKAKDFSAEITIFNAKEKMLSSEKEILVEHIVNNQAVRAMLVSRGIISEKTML